MSRRRTFSWSALCRATLLLYPAPLRARLGDAIQATFEDRINAAAARGRLHAAAVAFAELGNLARNGLAARRPRPQLSAFLFDVRHTLRSLRRRPGFAIVVVLILALGIGASTAMFSVIDSALLRPLPFRDADRIVEVWRLLPGGGRVTSWSQTEIAFWQDAGLFDALSGWNIEEVDFTGEGEPRVLSVARIDPDALQFLGVQPAAGRDFVSSEGLSGAEPVALVSWTLARQLAGSAAATLDTTIELDGVRHRVVGVMPARFSFPVQGVAAWVPVTFAAADARLPELRPRLYARLPAGQQVEAVAERGNAMATAANMENRLFLEAASHAGPTTRSALTLLFGGVALLLLSACANVANLMLAALTARQREIALRSALGAGRGRLVRQSLVESLLLAIAGGALGTLFATALIGAVIDLAPGEVSSQTANTVDVDLRALAFALAVALATSVAFGIVPALRGARQDPQAALAGARTATDARNRRLRHGLVIAEVAMAVVLLVAAALLGGSLQRMLDTDLGHDIDDIVTVTLRPSSSRYPTALEQSEMLERLADRLRTVGGVQAVALASGLPINGVAGFSFDIAPEGEGAPPVAKDPSLIVPSIFAGEGYFEAVGVSMVSGRGFSADELRDDADVVVLSRTMAERYFAGGDAVGRRFRLGPDTPWWTVVGVADEVKAMDVDEPFGTMELYLPINRQQRLHRAVFIVRTTSGARSIGNALRDAVAAEDPLQPIESIQSATEALWEQLATPRFYLALAGTFALAALALATFGIYGVISYTVNQRTREIGIRVALGAQRKDVHRLVLRLGVALAGAGVLLGTLVATWVSRLLESYLYRADAAQAPAFVVVAAGMLIVALAACWLPARRALRVDPMQALRAD